MTIENMSKYLYIKLEEYIEKGMLKGRKIVLFGLNTSSYGTKKYLENKGYTISAYIDNNKAKVEENNEIIDIVMPRVMQEKQYNSVSEDFIRAYLPEEYLAEFKDEVVVLIASKYYPEMCAQLENMGYKEGRHILKTADFYSLENILNDDDWANGLQKMDIQNLRNKQLELLEYLKDVCKRNQLRYYLGGGSCLGAVRHKGYIPWDDDIDVNLPYKDYLSLLNIINQEKKYGLVAIQNSGRELPYFFARIEDKDTIMKNWEYPFLITCGVSIDVFPIWGLPQEEREVLPFYYKLRRLHTRLIENYIENYEETEEVVRERENLIQQILKMLEEYDYDETENIGYTLSKHGEKDIMKKNIYNQMLEVPFENHSFSIMSGYDTYLKALYGKYDVIPKENEQRTTHDFKAYFRKKG